MPCLAFLQALLFVGRLQWCQALAGSSALYNMLTSWSLRAPCMLTRNLRPCLVDSLTQGTVHKPQRGKAVHSQTGLESQCNWSI